MAYEISNCNGMSGGVWSEAHDSRDDAATAIATAFGWDESVLSPSWTDDEEQTCWSVYETQEACDADETGAHAPTITRVAVRYTIEGLVGSVWCREHVGASSSNVFGSRDAAESELPALAEALETTEESLRVVPLQRL